MKRKSATDSSRGDGSGDATALLQSQRARPRFRDTRCVVKGGRHVGGSMQPQVRALCRTPLTDARRRQLHDLLRIDA